MTDTACAIRDDDYARFSAYEDRGAIFEGLAIRLELHGIWGN